VRSPDECCLVWRCLIRSHKTPKEKAPSCQAMSNQWLASEGRGVVEHFGTECIGTVCLGDRKKLNSTPGWSSAPTPSGRNPVGGMLIRHAALH
jgi:hypothetical protein